MDRSAFEEIDDYVIIEEERKLNHIESVEPIFASNQGDLYGIIKQLILRNESELLSCKSLDFGVTVTFTVRILTKMHFELLKWLHENAKAIIGTPIQSLETAVEDLQKVCSSIFHTEIMKINMPQIKYL